MTELSLVEHGRAMRELYSDDLPNVIGNTMSGLCDALEAAQRRVSELEAVLTPSAATKAAYMGEFSFGVELYHPKLGSETRSVDVPWTTIKEIMAAIRDRAAALRAQATSRGGDNG